jgi:hypothetical protein
MSDEGIHQGRSDSTASPQHYMIKASQEPKRQKTDERALRVKDPPKIQSPAEATWSVRSNAETVGTTKESYKNAGAKTHVFR